MTSVAVDFFSNLFHQMLPVALLCGALGMALLAVLRNAPRHGMTSRPAPTTLAATPAREPIAVERNGRTVLVWPHPIHGVGTRPASFTAGDDNRRVEVAPPPTAHSGSDGFLPFATGLILGSSGGTASTSTSHSGEACPAQAPDNAANT
ncbi:hypothetical protein FHW79_005382 [Azospirillum sp. OGB3]|uniref:hypothetical protein n=1 Tax=Azospirillum sp. OGB3 TaxID=2587012 RepID=UPI001605FB2A|nr:hypothetical protein [Azospirillum sp. OGB3]MBB3267717.1 hypothetical protein [Azospirillum sp. OGB3]